MFIAHVAGKSYLAGGAQCVCERAKYFAHLELLILLAIPGSMNIGVLPGTETLFPVYV